MVFEWFNFNLFFFFQPAPPSPAIVSFHAQPRFSRNTGPSAKTHSLSAVPEDAPLPETEIRIIEPEIRIISNNEENLVNRVKMISGESNGGGNSLPEESVPLRRHSNAFRRKSIIGARLLRKMSLTKSRKLSVHPDEVDGIEEEVLLRKVK